MMIDIDPAALDDIIRAWLKDTWQCMEITSAHAYVHPEDAKMYKKDIKALKRLLDYIGPDL